MGRFVFKLPDVGEGTAEAELVGWHVRVGDVVEEDQMLADVMTDKATVELTSPVSGKVTALHGEPGEQRPVGSPLVEFEVEGAGNASAVAKPSSPFPLDGGRAGDGGETAGRSSAVAEAAAPSVRAKPSTTVTPAQPSPIKGEGSRQLSARGERPLASPAVRQRARDLGVELQFVPGSGPAGRIEHADLDAYVSSGRRGSSVSGASAAPAWAQAEGTTETRIIGLRRKIAEKMAESVRRIPHITYVEEIDVTALEELRAHLNAANKGTDKPKLNVLPFIARAVVVALRDQPTINSHSATACRPCASTATTSSPSGPRPGGPRNGPAPTGARR